MGKDRQTGRDSQPPSSHQRLKLNKVFFIRTISNEIFTNDIQQNEPPQPINDTLSIRTQKEGRVGGWLTYSDTNHMPPLPPYEQQQSTLFLRTGMDRG